MIAVPLNTLLNSKDHRAVLEDCDPRRLVIDPALSDVLTWGAGGALIWTADEAARAIASAAPVHAYAPTHRDSWAFFRYSNGTAGEPKGGELGDLLVRGDSIMALTWNKHEATKHALRGDDVIEAGGTWVSPVEVEQALVSHSSETQLAPYTCPRWITVMPELPKTATGEIQRFLLSAR